MKVVVPIQVYITSLIAELNPFDKGAKLYEPIDKLASECALPAKINLNAVRVFAVAARHLNLQRAADELGLSHGAVSQRIRQLEGELGVVLFERRARGVTLTANGERYWKAADRALSILATASADLHRGGNQVVLHLGPSFASRWLMPRLQRFSETFSDIPITTEVHEAFLERALGHSEIAIWPDRTPQRAPGENVVQLTDVRLVAVCSPRLRRQDGPLAFGALLTLPLLQDSHRRWERLMATAGLQAKAGILNFDRSALALDAAIKGHGVAIAPDYMVADDVATGLLEQVWQNEGHPEQHLFLSWANQSRAADPVNQTVDWILAEFGLRK